MPPAQSPIQSTERSAGNPHFPLVFRGYDRVPVDERLAQLAAKQRELAQNRDEAMSSVGELTKALSYTQQELEETKAALARMATDPSSAATMTERVRTMMQLAEEEIAELLGHAGEQAEQIRAEAEKYDLDTRKATDRMVAEREAELAQRRDELEVEYQALTAALRAEHDNLMAEGRGEIERLDSEAEAERNRLDSAAAERRAAAEQSVNETLALKTAETEDALAKQTAETEERLAKQTEETEEGLATKKSVTEERLAKQTAEAEERAATLVADAERRLAEAEHNHTQAFEFRREVTARLTATNTALQEALKELGSTEAPS